jgi:hypothetical protein
MNEHVIMNRAVGARRSRRFTVRTDGGVERFHASWMVVFEAA